MEQKSICYDCFEDIFIKNEIKEKGTERICTCCEKYKKAYNTKEIADSISSIFGNIFCEIEAENIDPDIIDCGWVFTLKGIVKHIVRVNSDLIEDVVEKLCAKESCHSSQYNDCISLSNGCIYIERHKKECDYNNKWNSLSKSLKHSERFFNDHAKSILDDIFDINEIPIINIHASDDSLRLYRGRIALSENEKRKILSDCRNELGAPPANLTKNGRMNSRGISVFYFALNEMTCIAELRPPVGSCVVIGEFRLTKDMFVLDFTKFNEINLVCNFFDPNFSSKRSKSEFIKRINKVISTPVMPGDEDLDYLPTQFLIEYLASNYKMNIDGIIYESAQDTKRGRNLILFSHIASEYLLENLTKKRAGETNVDMQAIDEYEDEYVIAHVFDKESDYSNIEKTKAPVEYLFNSVKVKTIKSVTIDSEEVSCEEYNTSKEEREKIRNKFTFIRK